MSEFIVKYSKKDKPKGSQRFPVFAANITFENVLFQFTMNDLCMANYHMDYWYSFLNDHLFVERIQATGPLCVYTVDLYDMGNTDKLIAEYIVEIECESDDKSVDLYEEEETYKKKELTPIKKEVVATKWFRDEGPGVKYFIGRLQIHNGDLKKLKKDMSKATYYRNLKICEEKGYIVSGKLVKRTHINKTIY